MPPEEHVHVAYNKGFDAGYKAAMSEMRANYDNWRRSTQNANALTTSIGSIADLAVRQVIYGNPTGTAPHEIDKEKKA